MYYTNHQHHMFMRELAKVLSDNKIDFYDEWYDVDFNGPVNE